MTDKIEKPKAKATKAPMPPRRPVTTATQRRAETLKVILNDPNTKALAAEVPMSGLIAYLAELRDLGLIDRHERLTPAGAYYRALYLEAAHDAIVGEALPSIWVGRRAVWNRVGGDEPTIDKAFAALIEKGLVAERGEGVAREYALT